MNELLQQLTANLGIDATQAKGGVGALLNLAKDKLGQGEFAQVTGTLGEAPAQEAMGLAAGQSGSGGGGLLGAASGLLGGLGGQLGGLGSLADLAKSVSAFGIDASTLHKFLPIVVSFLEKKGGPGVAAVLSKVIGR